MSRMWINKKNKKENVNKASCWILAVIFAVVVFGSAGLAAADEEESKEIPVLRIDGNWCDEGAGLRYAKYSGNVSDGGCRYRSGGWHRRPGDQLSDFHDHQQGRGGEWKYVEPVLYSALACRGVRDLCGSNRHGGRIFSVKASDEAEPAGCNSKRIIRQF